MSEAVTLLGATGSIGQSTIDVVKRYPERFNIEALAGGSRVEPLVAMAKEVHPRKVAIADETQYDALKTALSAAGLSEVKVLAGSKAVAQLAEDPETDCIVQAIVGAAGVEPTFKAAKAGKRLLLANKESVVCGGELLMKTIAENHAKLLPVDSEHNAIFQCLEGARPEARQTCLLYTSPSPRDRG